MIGWVFLSAVCRALFMQVDLTSWVSAGPMVSFY